MGKYDHLDRDALVRLLERRDAERQLGLVWERDELDAEAAQNDDYVTLEQDEKLSHGDASWRNLIIEGDNYDALRALRMSHAGRIRRIAPYRLATRIQHDEVWHALQLIAGFRAGSIAKLRDWLGESSGAGLTLYAWNLARAAELAPAADLARVPDTWRARFGR